MGARFVVIQQQVRRAFTFEGMDKLVRRPDRAVKFLLTQLQDVKYRKTSAQTHLSVLRNSIVALSNLVQVTHPVVTPLTVEQFVGRGAESQDTADLRALFQKYGSDKSTGHNYHLIYSQLLSAKRRDKLNILEIGLGTNNIDVPSNMGLEGKPGASLRAFRDWAPHSNIFGADVDKRILFSENRIQTFFVDQTSREALANLAACMPAGQFDLIIDDGLHNSEANLNTLLFAIPLIRENGVIVIEDIGPSDLPFWQIVFGLLAPRYKGVFLNARGGCLVIIQPAGR